MKGNERGITLIALVVTIIVLIILAGVSISLILGENGIITKSKQSKENYQIAANEEQEKLTNAEAYLNNLGGTGTTEIPVEKTIVAYREAKIYTEEKTILKDSNENLIVVPKGFKIADDSGDSVEEGIVIEDNDVISGVGNNRGNQYVWIPVGEGIKKDDDNTVDIELGRYVFADGTNHKSDDGTVLPAGTPILKQSAENYIDETEIYMTDENPTLTDDHGYMELVTSRIGQVVESNRFEDLNTTALNLKGFIDSVNNNRGYYIARYEASYGATDGKANSKISNSYSDTTAPTTEGQLWNFITQINAAEASRGLYTTATTDLINSYAWDTAIVYIQKFSNDTDYSRQDGNSINASLSNTGNLGENIKDEVCKINDMSSNTREWTTEYSNNTNSSMAIPCVYRGGCYEVNNLNTNSRSNDYAISSFAWRTISFRIALYI